MSNKICKNRRRSHWGLFGKWPLQALTEPILHHVELQDSERLLSFVGNRRHGEQDSTDRLGSFDQERALHAENNLKELGEHEIARPAK